MISAGNLFAHLELAPPDPILGTAIAYKNDPSPSKVNLGIGAYRTDAGVPYVFQSVRESERLILEDPSLNKEYLTIDGLAEFNQLARELILGVNSPAIADQRVTSTQTLSGTGSLRVGAEFLKTFLNPPAVYLSKPTWGNHLNIFKKAGYELREYPYWKAETRGFDCEGMLQALSTAPAGSVVLLHPCAHNPTGVDPTPAEWERIAQLISEKRLVPYFDSAYQGFASGDLEKDAFSIRLFVERGFQIALSQSFAKNMGLYGERIGAFHVVCADRITAEKVLSQLKTVIRPMYSNPPLHGALIAARILGDPALRESWMNELKEVSNRIIQMRGQLRGELEKLGTPGDWSHITNQIGMFSYTGLTVPQCERMIANWHCYMLKNGRISMAGMTTGNVEYVARAVKDCIENA